MKTLTDRFHVVLLDQLVSEPTRTMERIHDFLGLSARSITGPLPQLNPGDGRSRHLARIVARWTMRTEANRAESLLNLRAGSLS